MTDLPPGWEWTTIGEAGHVELGMARNPARHHGPNLKPYLRVANVFEDRFDLSDVKVMNFTPAEFEHYTIRTGDILLNEGQSPELLGRPALWREQQGCFAFTNSLIRFQAYPGVLPEWALLVFRHYMHSGRFTKEVRITTNIAHLSASRFKSIEFPVPPVEEQARVCSVVNDDLLAVSALEDHLRSTIRKSQMLKVQIMDSAFGGRL